MGFKNNFYVAKLDEKVDMLAGYSWSSGKWDSVDDYKIASTDAIDVSDVSRLSSFDSINKDATVLVYTFNKDMEMLPGPIVLIAPSILTDDKSFDFEIRESVKYVAIEVRLSEIFTGWDYSITKMREVTPHYKNLKKAYKKEDNQLFFRESLEGKINLFGRDYLFVKESSIEDKLVFYIYRDGVLYTQSRFNKTDCKFDHFKRSVELKLTPHDKYVDVLNGYDKTHDLLKLAVGKNVVSLTKRSLVQIYIQGEKTITNYASGAYWEDEVSEAIDDANLLLTKYYFSAGPTFKEIVLDGFNYDINGTYKCSEGESVWNCISTKVVNGAEYRVQSSIKFEKVYSAGDRIDYQEILWTLRRMSDGAYGGFTVGEDGHPYADYDSYRIQIYTNLNGTGTKLYESENICVNDSNFMLASGNGLFKMVAVNQSLPNKQPEPSEFYLGVNVIDYPIWGRLLCDVDKSTDGTILYDLPYDDFATERANFRKCIGLVYKQGEHALIRFKQSASTQKEPTPYGLTDYGEYFTKPVINGTFDRLFAYPLAKSSWGNTSLWVAFEEDNLVTDFGLENWSKKYYKTIQHRDCMEIGAAIKALLNELDDSLSFESTEEYSEFLYGTVQGGYGARGQQIYITQKSNVLKGEYDQAAQKAEITFKQLMNMLCNCFRCYWYIDSQNRFRIEHIRYFMNGLSYTTPDVQYDLTEKLDRFNRLPVSYDQQEITFSKSELYSRYEFAWSDDVTEVMGGGFSVDIKSNYVEQDKIDSINIELFTSDIDYMMFSPSDFSQDGFALIIAEDNKVPIIYNEMYDQRDTQHPMRLYTQNYHASFLDLFNNYLYDMPASQVSSSCRLQYMVSNVKRCMEHHIKFQPCIDPDMYKLVGTDVGYGYIEEVITDVDTGLAEVTLMYEPR